MYVVTSRRITIRQFQRKFYQEIENLPIVVTKRSKDFIVVTLTEGNVVTKPKSTRIIKDNKPIEDLEDKDMDKEIARLKEEAFNR